MYQAEYKHVPASVSRRIYSRERERERERERKSFNHYKHIYVAENRVLNALAVLAEN